MDQVDLLGRLRGLLDVLEQPSLDYGVNMARWPDSMKGKFIEFGPDQALLEYLERAKRMRASRWRTSLQRLLRFGLSDYDVNALLGMYPMHLFSEGQIDALLRRPRGGRLLDIGAGSGDVTEAMTPLFDETVVVETSWAAGRQLRSRGFECHRYDAAEVGIRGSDYQVISLLNVLDRADRPLTLLERCRVCMTMETVLLISVPLPYRPHVYAGPATREPKERMPIVGSQFSDAVPRLIENVLNPAGFRVERLTRLPYLSGGDSARALTVLDAVVLACRRLR